MSSYPREVHRAMMLASARWPHKFILPIVRRRPFQMPDCALLVAVTGMDPETGTVMMLGPEANLLFPPPLSTARPRNVDEILAEGWEVD